MLDIKVHFKNKTIKQHIPAWNYTEDTSLKHDQDGRNYFVDYTKIKNKTHKYCHYKILNIGSYIFFKKIHNFVIWHQIN